jgi:hypothetical protein
MRYASIAWLACAALGLAALPASATPDSDGDGVIDMLDNCSSLANAPPLGCDSDQDGYGNLCDGDFNNNKQVTPADFAAWLLAFKAGTSTAVHDLDCNASVNAHDWEDRLLPAPDLNSGRPGPSGLLCAGTIPCAP